MNDNTLKIENISGQLVVDSRLVAQELGIKHKPFIQTIRKYKKEIEQEFGQLLFEKKVSYREQGGGNPETFCYLNEDQTFYLMTLSKNTPQVRACKRLIVKSFSEMKKLLLSQEIDQVNNILYDFLLNLYSYKITTETDVANILNVYLIGCQKEKTMKIGVSYNVEQRLKSLQSSNANKLELLDIIEQGGYQLESMLHNEFSDLNIQGEWFKWSEEIIKKFETLKNSIK